MPRRERIIYLLLNFMLSFTPHIIWNNQHLKYMATAAARLSGRRTSIPSAQICHLVTPCTRNSQKELQEHWLYWELEQMCQSENTSVLGCVWALFESGSRSSGGYWVSISVRGPQKSSISMSKSSISQKNKKSERLLIERGVLRPRSALSNHTT